MSKWPTDHIGWRQVHADGYAGPAVHLISEESRFVFYMLELWFFMFHIVSIAVCTLR